MKPIHYFSLLLYMSILAACSSKPAVTSQISTDTIPVKVMSLRKENSKFTVAVSGQFTTDDEVMLSFKIGGIINGLFVKEGDAVKKGQLLATLNPVEINAQVQQAKLSVEKARRDYQRTQNLYKDSVATLEQLQNGKTALQQAQQQLSMASFNRQYAEIRAPKNGYILKKMANAGQQIAAGTPALQANGAQADHWMLRVSLSDNEWSMLRLKDEAVIETTALPGQQFNGILSRKAEGVDPATGTFTADITLTGPRPKAIAAGMFGKATISPQQNTQTAANWQIPYEALLDGDGSSGYVFITNDNKTAQKVKVTLGRIDKNAVTVTQGLEKAKALVISGSAYLTHNSAITIQSTVNPAK
ncbi:efflux RND transporter periplasmic adaptor subunit [Pedobacter sp. MC2016-14]|uniref:efflux RND transporter periplasmic adaptor subunit n=1 Tax=Pedobacter sp. MC2016-14 TaxID=2897327 RepID=UPI001E5061E6|nr:efflux RND transporter periplasmic adaptor subunit [Pedobacter sp. MC2016-14]MCD0487744.1 efflux RND transporter periplasmic adaptor subunit [Pedobacter sp. MC2016-14]